MSSPNVIEADLVVLDDSLVPSGQAFPLSSAAPNIIRAWRVQVRGVAKAIGQDVTIVANQVEFSSTDSVIDTSGKDAQNTWQPGNKPLPSDTPGTTGTTGAAGGGGTRAGNVAIFAASIIGKV